jgi:hypothetical protein
MNILDGQIDFHGLTLRPLTIGSMELCRAFGLGLFTGEQVTPPEQIRQTAAPAFTRDALKTISGLEEQLMLSATSLR